MQALLPEAPSVLDNSTPRCDADEPLRLVPLAESPAGLSAPLRGAASPLRPSSFSRGFTPNPAVAARPPSAARLLASLRLFFWRAALAVGWIASSAQAWANTEPPPAYDARAVGMGSSGVAHVH